MQILLEALSEYINRHYEYGSAVLSSSATDAVAVAWSAGVFEGLGTFHRHPSPTMKVSVEIMSSDIEMLTRLRDTWGGTLYKERSEQSPSRGVSESWVWGLRSEKAKRFLETTLPYMKGSKSETVKSYLIHTDDPSEGKASLNAG